MSRTTRIAALLITLTLVAAVPAITAHAEQSKGNSLLQLSGGFIHAQGAEIGTLNVDVGYGYFLTESWEVGLTQTFGYSWIDGAENQWVASTIPYFSYNIRGLSLNNRFQPFIGAFAGASYNSDDATGTIGPHVGFRSFVNDTTFIMLKYRYEWFFDKLSYDDIRDTQSDGNHVVTLGVGFVF